MDFVTRPRNKPLDLVGSLARMKAGKEHKIPLSDAAMAALRAMRSVRTSDYVFPGQRTGRPLRSGTVWKLAQSVAGVSVHGLRSSFRDWAAERTNFQREVCEMALAHAIPNAVEAAYRRPKGAGPAGQPSHIIPPSMCLPRATYLQWDGGDGGAHGEERRRVQAAGRRDSPCQTHQEQNQGSTLAQPARSGEPG